MLQNTLGRTGRTVSTVGLGTWQLGADWGDVDEDAALEVLRASADAGVTFFDTADVYGDGRSEQIIGRFLRENASAGLTVATKMGREARRSRVSSPSRTSGRGRIAPAATSASTPLIWSSCTARPPRSSPPTPFTTISTCSSPRAPSPTTA